MEVKVELGDVSAILRRAGADANGDVQRELTTEIDKRLTAYMPFSTSALIKNKHIVDPTTIEVVSSYAIPMYNGFKYVNAATGKGPAYIPNVGYRYKLGAKLRVTDIPYNYDKTKNRKAGPYWDRRMMADESDKIARKVTKYANGSR